MSERVLAKMAYRAEPEGVLAIFEAPARELPRGGTLYLVAVGIEKPGNLGAMARTAEAAGADALVVAEAEADVWNPNAIRASTGAVFTLPVVEAGLDEVRGLDVRRRRSGRRRTDALQRRRPDARRRRSSSAPRTRASTSAGALPPTSPSRSRCAVARPTASTPRPPRRSSSSRRCASVVSRDDVFRARETIRDRLPRTPMLTSRQLGARLKCELFQRTGSFKTRGALNRLSTMTAEEKAARRDRDLGRQPRAGRRLGRRRGRRRRARRHVAGRVGAEARRDARLRRRRRPRGERADRGVRAALAADGRDRAHARAPAQRPRSWSRAPARSASRSRRTRPTPMP